MNNALLAAKPQAGSRNLSKAASLDLDLLRGTAALAVVISHWRSLFYKDLDQLSHPGLLAKAFYLVTGLGHQAVMVFFVLSGYLVGGSVMRGLRDGRWSWRHYALDRLTRLYTVLVPALILGLVWDSSGICLNGTRGVYGGNPEFKYIIAYRVMDRLNPVAFAGSLTFLQTVLVPPFGSNGALWSLANEFWYYVAFPLALIAFSTQVKWTSRTIATLGVIVILLASGRSIATLFLVWLMGALLAYRTLPNKAERPLARYGSLGAWLIVLLLHRAQRLGLNADVADVILGVATCVWLATLVTQPECSRSNFRTKVSELLSKTSYSCYLLHLPLLVWLVSFVQRPRWEFSLVSLGAGLLALVPVALYVTAGWWAFERNTPRLRKWINDRFPDQPTRVPTEGQPG